jgi:hypothetical protein
MIEMDDRNTVQQAASTSKHNLRSATFSSPILNNKLVRASVVAMFLAGGFCEKAFAHARTRFDDPPAVVPPPAGGLTNATAGVLPSIGELKFTNVPESQIQFKLGARRLMVSFYKNALARASSANAYFSTGPWVLESDPDGKIAATVAAIDAEQGGGFAVDLTLQLNYGIEYQESALKKLLGFSPESNIDLRPMPVDNIIVYAVGRSRRMVAKSDIIPVGAGDLTVSLSYIFETEQQAESFKNSVRNGGIKFRPNFSTGTADSEWVEVTNSMTSDAKTKIINQLSAKQPNPDGPILKMDFNSAMREAMIALHTYVVYSSKEARDLRENTGQEMWRKITIQTVTSQTELKEYLKKGDWVDGVLAPALVRAIESERKSLESNAHKSDIDSSYYDFVKNAESSAKSKEKGVSGSIGIGGLSLGGQYNERKSENRSHDDEHEERLLKRIQDETGVKLERSDSVEYLKFVGLESTTRRELEDHIKSVQDFYALMGGERAQLWFQGPELDVNTTTANADAFYGVQKKSAVQTTQNIDALNTKLADIQQQATTLDDVNDKLLALGHGEVGINKFRAVLWGIDSAYKESLPHYNDAGLDKASKWPGSESLKSHDLALLSADANSDAIEDLDHKLALAVTDFTKHRTAFKADLGAKLRILYTLVRQWDQKDHDDIHDRFVKNWNDAPPEDRQKWMDIFNAWTNLARSIHALEESVLGAGLFSSEELDNLR